MHIFWLSRVMENVTMHFFPNLRIFPSAGQPDETRIRDSLREENDAARNKKDPASIKTLSRYALRHNLMIFAYYIVRFYFLTIRIESINEDTVQQHLKNGNKMIAALWHQRIIAVIGYAKRFGGYRPSVMISKSRDGDLIADIYSRLKFRPVRGSTSHGGKEALAAMVDDLRDHPFAVHVLDGPKGPRGVVKPGVIAMAKQSGVPIVPVYISMSRAWILRSWDHCLIPKPFSKVLIRWDCPRAISSHIDERTFEDIRMGIEIDMLENQRRDDRWFGWRNLI